MRVNEVFGPGGFDPSKPNNNVIAVEEVPDPPAPEPTAEERLATLLAALTSAQSLGEIRDAAAAAGGTP